MQWKDVPGFENYEVSSNGIVRHKKILKIRKMVINPRGYYKVLTIDKTRRVKNWFIHRLVAECFLPKPGEDYEVNHIDCNKSNNDISNLEWVTHKENMAYYKKMGKPNRGLTNNE